MISIPLPLADIGNIEKTVIQGLAIAGGVLVGYFTTGFLAKVFAFARGSQQQRPLTAKATRSLGGITAGILVYLLLGGEGGLGLGGKGGGDSPDAEKGGQPKELIREQSKSPNTFDSEAENFEIFILRADSPDKKFYRVGKEGTPQTIEELLIQLDARMKAGSKPIKLIKISAGDPEFSDQAESFLRKKLDERSIASQIIERPKQKK